jgi:hypothetical protein
MKVVQEKDREKEKDLKNEILKQIMEDNPRKK